MNTSHTRWSNSGKMSFNKAEDCADTDGRRFSASAELSHSARQPHSSRRKMHSIEEPMASRVPPRRPNDWRPRLDDRALQMLAPAS